MDAWTMKDTCQTTVIASKLGKFQGDCANLGAQLGRGF